jgi:hypothetical protein
MGEGGRGMKIGEGCWCDGARGEGVQIIRMLVFVFS